MAITTLTFVKDYLDITDTSKDIKITALIPLVEQNYLDIRNIPFDTDENDDIVYPPGADVVASEMIGYKLSTIKDSGRNVTSESIDSYSISYGDASGSAGYGYPKSITSSITRYINGA